MRHRLLLVIVAAVLAAGCRRELPDGEKDTFSRKAGRVAYKAAQEAGKAAESAGKEIKKDAVELKKGWQDAQKEDRVKKSSPAR